MCHTFGSQTGCTNHLYSPAHTQSTISEKNASVCVYKTTDVQWCVEDGVVLIITSTLADFQTN